MLRVSRGELVAALVLSAFFALTNLASSFQDGILSTAAVYDDVVYLVDGFERKLALQGQPFYAGLRDFFLNPPHSPPSTLLAMLGYTLFGPWFAAPYITNVAWLLLYAVALMSIFAPWLGSRIAMMLTACFMLIPISHAMMTEFRPDMGAALLLAIAGYALINYRHEYASTRDKVLLGLLAAAAVMAKPSAVLISIPMIGFAGLCGLGLTFWRLGKLGSTFRAVMPVLVTFLIVIAVFGVVWGQVIYDYLVQVFSTNIDIWRTPGTPYQHWTFYSIGYMGSQAFGYAFFPLLLVVVADAALLLYRRPDGYVANLLYLVFVIAIYVGTALSEVKSVFQASYFAWPFIIAAADALKRLLYDVSGRFDVERWLVWPGVAAAILLAPWSGQYAARQPDGTSELVSALESEVKLKAAAMKALKCEKPMPVISSFAPYPIAIDAVKLEGLLKHGLQMKISALYFARSFPEQADVVQSADLVLMPPQQLVNNNSFPGYAFHSTMERYLTSREEWEAKTMPAVHGLPLTLFVRRGC